MTNEEKEAFVENGLDAMAIAINSADKLVQCENRMAAIIKRNKELEGIILIHLSNFGSGSGVYIYTFKICY